MAGSSKANQRQGSRRKRQYDAYDMQNRREKNKLIRLTSHVKRNPGDTKAKANLVLINKGGIGLRGGKRRLYGTKVLPSLPSSRSKILLNNRTIMSKGILCMVYRIS